MAARAASVWATMPAVSRIQPSQPGAADLSLQARDLYADFAIDKHWSIGAYYGYAQASRAIQAIYPKESNGHLAYVEMSWKL